jgi:hypothetical protein
LTAIGGVQVEQVYRPSLIAKVSGLVGNLADAMSPFQVPEMDGVVCADRGAASAIAAAAVRR